MGPKSAGVLILDCGRMVGHKKTELELPKKAVPFFGAAPTGSHSHYIRVLASNGRTVFLRMIYRPKNGMWRIELTTNVPEVGSLIPEGSRRSDHAAIFEKVLSNDSIEEYELSFVEVNSPDYEAVFTNASHRASTTKQNGSRRYGWY